MESHSDSQVTYHSVTTSCEDYDTDQGVQKFNSRRKPMRRRTITLSRTKRVSRSFASGLRIEKSALRRCSTPAYRRVLSSGDMGAEMINCPTNSVTAALLLAHQTLQLSCPLLPAEFRPPVPAPLVVEDPPSSDNASDLEEDTVRYNLDPVFLNGSSSNFGNAGVCGSVGSARSAPSTPHGALAAGNTSATTTSTNTSSGSIEPHSQPCSPSYMHTTIPKSPSHVFAKYDKGSLKQLSSSAPLMTAQARTPEPPSPKGAKADKMPAGPSKARQKKFHRHFTQVDLEERVLNYYSCALVGDILLQGHLYITKNYFAFYSNVFGYVTKVLIPIASVLKVSKERTAKIIPNAVGVVTAEDRHVFGSLLSRDSTYKLMNMVLKAAHSVPITLPEPPVIDIEGSEFSNEDETSSQSGQDSPTLRSGLRSHHRHTDIIPAIANLGNDKVLTEKDAPVSSSSAAVAAVAAAISNPSSSMKPEELSSGAPGGGVVPGWAKYHVFLLVSTLLLLLLFTSAGVLLYRISRIQTRYALGRGDLPHHTAADTLVAPTAHIYNEILHWHSQLHTKSAGAVHSFLDNNLDQIAKVRKSLEALSTLLMPNSPSGSQAQAPEHRSEVPPETNKHHHPPQDVTTTGTATGTATAS